MEVFVARQPIFDRSERVCAYELLYRSNITNEFPKTNGDQATTDVLVNSFLNIGFEKISNSKKCFINFTENLLNTNIPFCFSPKSMVIEILEDVEPTKKVIETCKKLKKFGYTIALDDFVYKKKLDPLIEIADIIKIDFLATTLDERKKMMEHLKPMSVKLLAEKVETRDDFKEAHSFGYHYFQGYFFSKPAIFSANEIPNDAGHYFHLYEELNKKEPNIDEICNIIERDLSLSYQLLKFINSPAFSIRQKVHSIKHALMLVGVKEVKKMIYVLMLKRTPNKQASEAVRTCLSRAKMCELLVKRLKGKMLCSEYFFLGLFSMIDVILQSPMENILKELPISDEIKYALLGYENEHRKYLDFVIAIERGEWEIIQSFTPLEQKELSIYYKEALMWSNEVDIINSEGHTAK